MRTALCRGKTSAFLAASSVLLLSGCGRAPGYPGPAPIPPDQVVDFNALYSSNCAACHGANGQNGPAMELANPEYEALIDNATMTKWVSGGMPGTLMPQFAISAGGMLTDQQISALVSGIREHWSTSNPFNGATPPTYAQTKAGNPQQGAQVYKTRCEICHQPSPDQITSSTYLALEGDQALRSLIIAGRPDIGQPDWRHDSAGGKAATPLSPGDVDDIVTYLATLRNPSAAQEAAAPVSAPKGRKHK